MLKITFFTGSGISSPSGLATFRDSDGIWSRYKIIEVATPEAWQQNPVKVLEFYNLRRTQLGEVRPNQAHLAIARLEEAFDVVVITQNVDDLHERAGSTQVIHLHGELTKVRSEREPSEIIDIGYRDIRIGDTDSAGVQLRPHVVWFGEQVHNFETAVSHMRSADIIIVVGTSLTVFPAASLLYYAGPDTKKYLIDRDGTNTPDGFIFLQGSADKEVDKLASRLMYQQNSG